MKTISVNVNEMDWQHAVGYPGKAEEKVLSHGDTNAPRSILLKIPADWNMEAHSHRYTELHFVLEGEYESDGDIFGAGTFRMIPKEVEHGPFGSHSGATVLIIWCDIRE